MRNPVLLKLSQHLTSSPRGKLAPGIEVDVFADEADAAVDEAALDASLMGTAGTDQGVVVKAVVAVRMDGIVRAVPVVVHRVCQVAVDPQFATLT